MSCGEGNSKSVDAYIAKAPAFARIRLESPAVLTRGDRFILRAYSPPVTIGGGIVLDPHAPRTGVRTPCFEGRGLVCGLGAFQKHVRLFFFKGARVPDPEGVFADGEDNASGRSAKFASLEEIPVKKLERLIRAAAKLDAEGKAKPMPRARRPELPMPREFADALKRSSKARLYFETLPPSCRREYIEWISTAKRNETRERRLAEAIEMLSEGRRHNQQYRAKV